jgi:hypothetical protein
MVEIDVGARLVDIGPAVVCVGMGVGLPGGVDWQPENTRETPSKMIAIFRYMGTLYWMKWAVSMAS